MSNVCIGAKPPNQTSISKARLESKNWQIIQLIDNMVYQCFQILLDERWGCNLQPISISRRALFVAGTFLGQCTKGSLLLWKCTLGKLLLGQFHLGELIVGTVAPLATYCWDSCTLGNLLLGQFHLWQLIVGTVAPLATYCWDSFTLGSLLLGQLHLRQLIVGTVAP